MDKKIEKILEEVKSLAIEYKELTGKPLGVTGEIAEYNAAKILGLELSEARTPGYDAVGNKKEKIQIKGRCLAEKPKPGQRLSKIRLDQEWDSVILVLMDNYYEVLELWKAFRPEVEAAILAPGSKARNERGALSVSKFKQIGSCVWQANKA